MAFYFGTDERQRLVLGVQSADVFVPQMMGTWSEMEELPPSMSFSSLNGIYMAGTAEGLYISKDKVRGSET